MTHPASTLGAAFLAAAALTPTALKAELPPLISRQVLFRNPVKAGPQISPDGQKLAYLAPDKNGVLNVWVRTVGKTDDAVVTKDTEENAVMAGVDLDGGDLELLEPPRVLVRG